MSPNKERFQPPKLWKGIGTGMGTCAKCKRAGRFRATSSPGGGHMLICGLLDLAGVAVAENGEPTAVVRRRRALRESATAFPRVERQSPASIKVGTAEN
jgi:hypothetical protein